MKFRERWRLAGIIANEVRFQGHMDANPSNRARIKEDPDRILKALRSANRMNTFFTAMIIFSLAISSIASTFFIGENTQLILALSMSSFLALSFILIFFLYLLVTTGFFTSNTMRFPAILPLRKKDIENLYLLAFVRIFIAPTILILTIYPIGCFFVFGIIAGLFALIGCAVTISLAIGALIVVSKWYYKKTITVDESKFSVVIRMAMSVGLLVGMIMIYSVSSFLPALLDAIVTISSTLGEGFFVLLSLIFPFSFGTLLSSMTFGPIFSPISFIASAAASTLYTMIAGVAYLRIGRSLRSMALGGVSVGRVGLLRELEVEIVGPIKAVIKKDLKLATRNLGSSMVFALPLLMIFTLVPMLSQMTVFGIRSMVVLVAVAYASSFSGIVIVAIMMFDTQGASIYEGLPLSTRLILNAKTAIMLVPFILTMAVLTVILLLNSLISPFLILIPIFQLPCGYAVGAMVAGFIYRFKGGGRAVSVNLGADQKISFVALIVAALVSGGPIVAYGLTLLSTGNHLMSVFAQLGVAIIESLIAWVYIPRILKD